MRAHAKHLPMLIAAILLSLLPASVVKADRLTIDLATDWKFIKQDAGPQASTEGWEAVTVPHTWNNLDAQKGTSGNPGIKGGYFRGPCWYSRSLDAPATWANKRVFVRFEAASIVAQVYLNGESLGEHRGAFTAFCFELTSHLHIGQRNELRVRVDNSPRADVPPISGDFNMDGGLYRPARLIVTDRVCVTPLDFASSGIYESIKSLDDQHASVEIRSLVSNGEAMSQSPRIETVINDAQGRIVAQNSLALSIAAGQSAPAVQVMEIASPHLWNGRIDPYLYSTTVRIHRGNDIVDEVIQPLGLRTVALSSKQGFLLNGRSYPIHGVNRHQDLFNQGWALSPQDHQRDAELILAMGATAVRNTHYPQSVTWHDLSDRNGLLMWDEVSLVNTINDSPAFTENSELEARELVLQLYNHPSIAFWGMFNELGNSPMPSPDELLKKIKAVIAGLDTSRLIVSASDHQKKSYNLIPDWTCYNTYPGWYGGAPPGLSSTIANFSREIGKLTALSEYGAGGNPFQHQEGPIAWRGGKIAGSPLHPEEYQDAVHEVDYAQISNNPHLWGSFLWVMFDFPAAPRHEGGTVGLNDKGMVTQDRKIKKDVYFFYQANWTQSPMIYIASRRMTPRTLSTTDIKVYSNCPSVRLKVNGQEISAVEPDKVHVYRWQNVALKEGENVIDATGTADDKTVTDRCTWILQAPSNAASTQPAEH